jgi:hypothetical protein
MKLSIMLSLFLMSSFAMALRQKGPMPQERTKTSKLENATVGRYIYVGDVPKFEGEEVEITISKMNLTTRVTAYVNQGRIDTYARQLFMRWKTINDALSDTGMSIHPLVKISKLAEKKNASAQAWAKIAEQYSSHILEKSGLDIYREKRNEKNFEDNQIEDDYKNTITEAYFKMLFDTTDSSDAVINDNMKLENLLSPANSQRLFQKHLGHIFTINSEKAGYLGYLTLVYPIAATVKGPFDQPKEQILNLKTAESIEARWWSDKWKDEFGGFPFLLLEWSGVAFHGPITNFSPLDVWFLRRDYVSHGCHRMDGSDVLELRSLLPQDLKVSANKVKVTILDYFDVTDWNKDGKLEAIDVKYYSIPTYLEVPKNKTIDDVIKPYLVENQQDAYLKKHRYASKYFDVATGALKNIPKYQVVNKKLVREGVHEMMEIYRFGYRPNRIIQYTETGLKLQGFDDSLGKYPPKFFQRY